MKEIRKLGLFTFFRSLTFFAPISVMFYCENGLSYFQIMILQSIYGMMTALFEIPSGALSDIIGRKKTLIFGTIMFAMAFACGSVGRSMALFVVMQVMAAAGQSCYSGTFVSLMYEDVIEDKSIIKSVNHIFATMQSINISGVLLSALLSSVVVKMAGMRYTYHLTLAAYIVTFVISLFLKDQRSGNDGKKSLGFSEYLFQLKQNYKCITENGIELIMMDLLLYAMFANTFSYIEQPILTGNGLNIELLGVVTVTMTVGVLIALKLFPYLERGISTQKGIFAFTLSAIILTFSNFFINNIFFNVISFLFLTVVLRFREIILTNEINKYINNDSRATFMSVVSALQMAGMAALGLVAGKIADVSISYTIVFLCSVMFGVYMILTMVRRRKTLK